MLQRLEAFVLQACAPLWKDQFNSQGEAMGPLGSVCICFCRQTEPTDLSQRQSQGAQAE